MEHIGLVLHLSRLNDINVCLQEIVVAKTGSFYALVLLNDL